MAHRFIVAGGGTAGHIEPALAVADAICVKDSTAICEFLGTDGGLEKLLVPQRGYRLRTIPKVVLPRKINLQSLTFPLRFMASIFRTRGEIKGADVVIGFGGYVSTPAYLAAYIKRIPIIVHEANAKPGWANRLGRRLANITAVNFAEVQKEWSESIVTGMPIRSSISNVGSIVDKEKFRTLHAQSWGFDPHRPIVAIFGGSQGSSHINKVISEYLEEFLENDTTIQILHAVGINNPLPQARTNYFPMPYFHDMAAIYGSSDLLITRSGAVTCSELSTLGKYAILIPLPHGNGEQVTNAQSLVDNGAAMMIDNSHFTAEWLNTHLATAIENSRKFSPRPDSRNLHAAEKLAELAIGLVKR
jgi:UDP-N-acetylglucosamine--N-acetylmuramyl-(pentapeptide) pyrophosphoryl-undecaprenol N-acetylglucosamine transferase